VANGSYAAARTVGPILEAHFIRHLAEARERGEQHLSAPPNAAAIEAIIDAGFWASLRREEGFEPKISLAFLRPEESATPLMFERPLRLEPAALAKIAPAVERPGIHLGVFVVGDELRVWGATRSIPAYCFVLEVAAPGVIVVKHHRGEESGKYVNVAVLEGDQIKMVDEQASSLPDCPDLLTSLLGFASPGSWIDPVNVLVQLAVSMRSHRRGGLLLVVPAGIDEWRESIARPIPYAVSPAFPELARLVRAAPEQGGQRPWQDELSRAVDVIGGLTAVDGATVVTSEYELLAFGAKIVRRKGAPQIASVTVTEPIEGGLAAKVDPTQLGGTRHLAAAQFVQDQPDAVALVASQDGRFTILAWSPCEGTVHAHRVETLLL
jgi:hypothetical protein